MKMTLAWIFQTKKNLGPILCFLQIGLIYRLITNRTKWNCSMKASLTPIMDGSPDSMPTSQGPSWVVRPSTTRIRIKRLLWARTLKTAMMKMKVGLSSGAWRESLPLSAGLGTKKVAYRPRLSLPSLLQEPCRQVWSKMTALLNSKPPKRHLYSSLHHCSKTYSWTNTNW